ncbi:SDR family oxidoreductase [Paenibacillus chartarius]|uniref:SDR family oxidoreductase n=1 Tax=Paenibacillus chartarius TaxID=747481 RepID=A0ABV6DJ16_9BACL
MEATMLVTGITGNVGEHVAEHLIARGCSVRGAVTNTGKAAHRWGSKAELVRFDYLDESTFDDALQGISGLFLIRPPSLADPNPMLPLIVRAKERGVKHIVFLSLLGIERNPLPPHYRIEKYVRNSGIPFTFLRPSFFMQNLNTIHRTDIRDRGDIFIPAGKAPVSFIDARDVGEAAALAMLSPELHANRSYTLTGAEALTYEEAAAIFTRVLGRIVTYSNPSAGQFRREMVRRGMPREHVNVMITLYFTTKLGLAKRVTPELEHLLGRKPATLEQYVQDYADYWR